ncbi:DUF5000 domain-containing lipoprotein [Niabella drilacis]|uniref:F5/8 type C domain-containing protein n=1 Tax=Niabella drilacis (strain DSM 25811 / CCM 8410 / CCUG 62505 / LMG 26954 / E90) TaxID=1285928 RepID=A0A1G6R6L2_NIADE|nr:DUF5000 domain-containing lipoprotein [Niabella drilacis]SDD00290.1 protein of unknown function [Niabella drilacis]
MYSIHFWSRSVLSKITACALLAVLTTACKREEVGQPRTDSQPPSAITSTKVTATPGGAVISYSLPNETDISYVLCEYTGDDGEKKVTRSSVYQNSIKVEGLGKVAPVDYSLYLVDHSENRSQPFSGSFVPLEPALQTVFRTVKITPDFSGVLVNWTNETQELLGFFLYAVNDQGKWEEQGLSFSSRDEDVRALRGYDTTRRQFGVRILDRFGHTTDTLVEAASPLFEKQLDKKKFTDGYLAGDNNTSHNTRPLSNVWDGSTSVIWHTVPTAGFVMPETFTIDLGVSALLSRMVLWNRLDYSYSQHNPRFFEVWGSNTLSHGHTDKYWETDDWKNEWTLLGDFEEVKPSGGPGITNEDKAAEAAGFEFLFKPGAGKMRYLRFVIKETWQKTAAIHFAELSIFGDDSVH